ncbi:MAG: 1-deoxy-D-xylulose-5-phosphate reductoisomerase, partial [Pseudomonadota bacterium]
IGFALHWPKRKALPVERLDLANIGQFSFRAPDDLRYPALRLAREVMEIGGLAGAAFNAAKEQALDAFIAGEIGFMQMAEVVEEVLNQLETANRLRIAAFTLDDVRQTDHLSRQEARNIMRAWAA